MLRALGRLFGGPALSGPPASQRQRLVAQEWPAAIYAVGDVHGCLAEMRALEGQIVEDGSAIDGEKWIVYLGDYIDRGPASAGVLDHLTARAPAGFRRICLVGNHEVMALEFFRNPRPRADWLAFGGQETLASYGLSLSALSTSLRANQALLQSHIPSEHIAFLEDLPLSLSVPGYAFVHAGIRPGVPLESQQEDDLLWIREVFHEAPALPGLRIVHGHTPAAAPVLADARICLDTGAFATGILTAARLTPDGAIRIFNTAP